MHKTENKAAQQVNRKVVPNIFNDGTWFSSSYSERAGFLCCDPLQELETYQGNSFVLPHDTVAMWASRKELREDR